MREAARSQLRRLLLIWATAWLVWLVGYCIALAVLIYGFAESFRSFTSLAGLLPMGLGVALQLVLCVLMFGIRDRFERLCWELIVADAGSPVGDATGIALLAKQADGEDSRLAQVRVRQSQRFSKRLKGLIEQAWPDRAGR